MVIQIPNPLLLPQSYGMGEIAGMAFGSNYVIMMQIGYRYYAPRIIEEMEKDNLDSPMGTVWWNKWQKFMKIYSDQSITNTMDRTLEMPEQALKAIWDKIFNILPSQETTLTSGSGADDDITFIRGARTRSQEEADRQKQFIRDQEQKRLQASANFRTVKAPKQGTPSQVLAVKQQIKSLESHNTRLKLVLDKRLAELKAILTGNFHVVGNMSKQQRLAWLRSVINDGGRIMATNTSTIKALKRNLQGMTLSSF